MNLKVTAAREIFAVPFLLLISFHLSPRYTLGSDRDIEAAPWSVPRKLSVELLSAVGSDVREGARSLVGYPMKRRRRDMTSSLSLHDGS